jgi:hypothetical protein
LVHKGLRFCGAGASACQGEAEPLYQCALTIFEKALGPDHPYTAISVRNYAGFLRERDRAAEAEKLEARFKAPGR